MAARRFVATRRWKNLSVLHLPASSFDQPLKGVFRPIYTLRTVLQTPFNMIAGWGLNSKYTISRFEPVLERTISKPIARLVDFLSSQIQALQMGDIRVYCFYIVFTLAVLLIVIFR